MNMPKEPHDPNVMEALAKITAITDQHDLGFIIILASTTHTTYAMGLSPSWSAITMMEAPDGGMVCRLKCAAKTGGPAEKEKGRLTAGLVLGLMGVMEFVRGQLDQMAGLLGGLGKISHMSQQTAGDKIKIETEEDNTHDYPRRNEGGVPPTGSD